MILNCLSFALKGDFSPFMTGQIQAVVPVPFGRAGVQERFLLAFYVQIRCSLTSPLATS
jgi:hypothetical protein